MKKFTLGLLTAALVMGSASAEKAVTPGDAARGSRSQSALPTRIHKPAFLSEGEATAAPTRRNAPVKKAIAGPSDSDKVIEETPEGKLTQYFKTGGSYGYNMFTGLVFQEMYGALSKVVISDDNKHLYLQNPIYFNYPSENNWIKGDINGDEVTFTFPQLIDIDAYYDDEGNLEEAYYDYAVCLEFMTTETDEEGFYYPAQKQTYSFRMNPDGSLTSLEDSGVMIGACNWSEDNNAWSWFGNGDFISQIQPLTETVKPVPGDVVFNEWQMISSTSHRPVSVGFKDDKVYLKGLFSSMEDAAVEGTIDGDRVVINGGQYLGEYTGGGTLAYFLTGETTGSGYEIDFEPQDYMEFSYDKTNNVLSSEDAFCISSSPTKVLYYQLSQNPYICIPATDFTVTKLINPQLDAFYDANDEYDYDAELYFIWPDVDADRNILPTDRLFYQVILDNEIFTFYNDEYELPEGTEETTEIPYDLNSEETSDFYAAGTSHGFMLHTRGFESFGIRTLYKAPDGGTIYSDILWAPGYEGELSSVKGLDADRTIVSTECFDLNGIRVSRPAKGVYVMRHTLGDGSVVVRKAIMK